MGSGTKKNNKAVPFPFLVLYHQRVFDTHAARKRTPGKIEKTRDSGAVEKAMGNGLVRESLYETKLSSMFACVFKHAQSKFVSATRKFVTFSTVPQSPIHGVVFPGWQKAGTGIAGARAASPRFSLIYFRVDFIVMPSSY